MPFVLQKERKQIIITIFGILFSAAVSFKIGFIIGEKYGLSEKEIIEAKFYRTINEMNEAFASKFYELQYGTDHTIYELEATLELSKEIMNKWKDVAGKNNKLDDMAHAMEMTEDGLIANKKFFQNGK